MSVLLGYLIYPDANHEAPLISPARFHETTTPEVRWYATSIIQRARDEHHFTSLNTHERRPPPKRMQKGFRAGAEPL